MAATAVRYSTLQRVDGSTQHTSVEVTDPLLWQGQRQGRAEGGASTLQLFNLLLFSVRIAKATCPSDTPSTMVGKWGQHCEPAGGLMLSWARASRDGWLRSSPHTPRTTEPRSSSTTRSSSGCRHPCCFPRRQYGPSRCTRPRCRWRRWARRSSVHYRSCRTTSPSPPLCCAGSCGGLRLRTAPRVPQALGTTRWMKRTPTSCPRLTFPLARTSTTSMTGLAACASTTWRRTVTRSSFTGTSRLRCLLASTRTRRPRWAAFTICSRSLPCSGLRDPVPRGTCRPTRRVFSAGSPAPSGASRSPSTLSEGYSTVVRCGETG